MTTSIDAFRDIDLPGAELDHGEDIKQAVLAMLRDEDRWTCLDHDLEDQGNMRPGRGYYVLEALFEALTETYGDKRKAANALVLSAARMGSEQLRHRK